MVKNACYTDIDVTGFPTLPRSPPLPSMSAAPLDDANNCRRRRRRRPRALWRPRPNWSTPPPARSPDPSRPAVEGPLPCHA